MITIDRAWVGKWLARHDGAFALLDRSHEKRLSDLAYRAFASHSFYPRIIASGSPDVFHAYWRCFFELILDDPHGLVIGHVHKGELVAAVSLCDACFPTAALLGRFSIHFLQDAGPAALLRYLRFALAFRHVTGGAVDKSRTAQGVWIFTAPGREGAGSGKALIRLCEQLLREMGFDFVQLMADRSDPALCRYYERLGYWRAPRASLCGAPVQVFWKRLLSSDFEVEVHTTVPRDWFGSGAFSEREYLQHVESCGFEGVRFWYLVSREGGVATACAALFSMPVDAATVLTGLFRRLIRFVRRFWPLFLKARVLVWGSPPSLANTVLHFAPAASADRIMPQLVRAAERIARWEAISWIVFKEYRGPDFQWARHLESLGYLRCDSPPRYVMPVKWSRYSDYLGALRHNYRRRLAVAEKKMREGGIRIERDREFPQPFSQRDYEQYLDVLSRARTQFERLPAAYFERLPSVFGERAALSRFVVGGRTVGWSWVLCDTNRTVNLFVGMDYGVNREHDLYVNILAEVVRLGIESGARSIHFGQAAADAKARLGATPEPMFYAVRHRNPVVHAVLRLFRRGLFRPEPAPRHQAFKDLESLLATAEVEHAEK